MTVRALPLIATPRPLTLTLLFFLAEVVGGTGASNTSATGAAGTAVATGAVTTVPSVAPTITTVPVATGYSIETIATIMATVVGGGFAIYQAIVAKLKLIETKSDVSAAVSPDIKSGVDKSSYVLTELKENVRVNEDRTRERFSRLEDRINGLQTGQNSINDAMMDIHAAVLRLHETLAKGIFQANFSRADVDRRQSDVDRRRPYNPSSSDQSNPSNQDTQNG